MSSVNNLMPLWQSTCLNNLFVKWNVYIFCREKDVAGIDINMGCPKEFSVKGGMGAALLKQRDKAQGILTKLVNGLEIPVSCKIRVFETAEDTVEFGKAMEATGISAIAVHGRTRDERPQHDNHNDRIRAVTKALRIPVIAKYVQNNPSI